jgi:peptidoglycan hydrolase-like protein with peptidoglycan-binding domain
MTATCIPLAVGVPGAGGPPTWWDLNLPLPALSAEIYDPRWQGSIAQTFLQNGSGTATEHAMFRALYDLEDSTYFLYLSWWIQIAPTLSPDQDELWVGLQSTAGNTFVFELPAFKGIPGSGQSTGPNPGTDPNGPAIPNVYVASAGAAGAPWNINAQPGTAPSWINQYERSWVDPTTGSQWWAVNLRVPATTSGSPLDNSGINLLEVEGPSTFKFWYEVRASAPNVGGGTQIIRHTWPRTITGHATATTVPNPSGWGDIQISGGPEDASCTAGVWIDASSIGTENTDAMGNPTPNTIKLAALNTFFVRPRNDSGNGIAAGQLHARFRLADWGSVPDLTGGTLWQDILPGGGDVTGAAIPAGTTGQLTFDWTMTAATSPSTNDFPPVGTHPLHQCMLVDLSGGAIDFGRSSVYCNMEFGTASAFNRPATISVKGLGALGSDPERDVFLYVQTLNLPSVVVPPQSPPIDDGPRLTDEVASFFRESPPTAWQIAQRTPTHMVHVYHRTGETITDKKGRKFPVLAPQTSFGVFMGHDGSLYGWDFEIQASTLQKLAPDFYRLRIPHDGTATVTQRVVAKETPDTSAVQFALSVLGYGIGATQIDGQSGDRTKAAVEAFQRAHPPLTVDGVVGAQTWEALTALSSAFPPTLELGSVGSAVGTLQGRLNAAKQAFAVSAAPLVVDSQFGAATQAVVEALQGWASLRRDGVVSYGTWAASTGPRLWDLAQRPGGHGPHGRPTVKLGSEGDAVQDVQFLLSGEGYGIAPAQIDRKFGAATDAAVKRFQTANGLHPDGVVGPETWKKLVNPGSAGPNPLPPTLQKNPRQSDVVGKLQKALNGALPRFATTAQPLVEDGVYGDTTAARVKLFQGWGAVIVDGIVGYRTWSVPIGPSVWNA